MKTITLQNKNITTIHNANKPAVLEIIKQEQDKQIL